MRRIAGPLSLLPPFKGFSILVTSRRYLVHRTSPGGESCACVDYGFLFFTEQAAGANLMGPLKRLMTMTPPPLELVPVEEPFTILAWLVLLFEVNSEGSLTDDEYKNPI